jgi:hypothetical protein
MLLAQKFKASQGSAGAQGLAKAAEKKATTLARESSATALSGQKRTAPPLPSLADESWMVRFLPRQK